MKFDAKSVAFVSIALAFCHSALARVSWIGTVAECENSTYIGKTIGFIDLDRSNPKYLWPSGHQTEAAKVYETKDLIVLVFVSDSFGSTETVHLEKINKRFTIVTVSTAKVAFPEALGKNPPNLTPSVCRGTLG